MRILTLCLAFRSWFLWASELFLHPKAFQLSVALQGSFQLMCFLLPPLLCEIPSVTGVLFSLFCLRCEHNSWSNSQWNCLWTSANCSVTLLHFCQCVLYYGTSFINFPNLFLARKLADTKDSYNWLTHPYDQIFLSLRSWMPLLHL